MVSGAQYTSSSGERPDNHPDCVAYYLNHLLTWIVLVEVGKVLG